MRNQYYRDRLLCLSSARRGSVTIYFAPSLSLSSNLAFHSNKGGIWPYTCLTSCFCGLVTKWCLTLVTPWTWGHSQPSSSVRGIFQAGILEWVAISFSRGSSQSRSRTQVSCIAGRLFTDWATREAKLLFNFSVINSLTLRWGRRVLLFDFSQSLLPQLERKIGLHKLDQLIGRLKSRVMLILCTVWNRS